MSRIDPVDLAARLIRCDSVTPREAGALDLIEAVLTPLGFACERMPFAAEGTAPVDNLYARIGRGAPHLAFAGHVDVVPPGDVAGWDNDPFAGIVADGVLHGRGAADMKGAIAAFIAAAAERLAEAPLTGSISLILTGDEEGPAINGTRPMIEALAARGEMPDFCIVGEPTNPTRLGEMIKIGRRGSVNMQVTIAGKQGHVAYPDLADNPIPRAARLVTALAGLVLDDGTPHFPPSNLEVTALETGEGAENTIPAEVRLRLNIRFNDRHGGASLIDRVRALCAEVLGPEGWQLTARISGEAFVTEPGPLVDLVAAAVAAETGETPALSTTGGTSDARFIAPCCPVVEFGGVGQTMHQVNERVATSDITGLAAIYHRILSRFETALTDAP